MKSQSTSSNLRLRLFHVLNLKVCILSAAIWDVNGPIIANGLFSEFARRILFSSIVFGRWEVANVAPTTACR